MAHTALTDFARMGVVCLTLGLGWSTAVALQSDRQKPLDIKADSSDGSLGDGVYTLQGSVEIRQGSLLIMASRAEVDKLDGKVRTVTFSGAPASLQQEIEQKGQVKAQANEITYQVASGIVRLRGSADVNHPQYKISGEEVTYDLNTQHFQGNGTDDGDGRIQITMDPEVVNPPEEPSQDPDN